MATGDEQYPSGYPRLGAPTVFNPPVDRELNEEEKATLLAEAEEKLAAEQDQFRAQARNRTIGYSLLGLVILVLMLPVAIIVGFETGVFVLFFNLARHL